MGQGALSAVQEIEQTYNIPVKSLVSLNALIAFIQQHPGYAQYAEAMQVYQQTYGISVS